MNAQLEVIARAFQGMFNIAQTELYLFGYWIAPIDIWLTTAIIYMLIDILLYYVGFGGDSDSSTK